MSPEEYVAALTPTPQADAPLAWFCLRSQPKHEHIAAAHLRTMGIEAVNPRIRFKRLTKYGPAPVVEALFPGYLFARFDLRTTLPRVHYAPGVKTVVHFGPRWPTVPDAVISELRARFGEAEIHIDSTALAPGDTVQIAGGAMHGLEAVVSMVMPGRQRVVVLMEFLGRQNMVELEAGRVIKPGARGG